MKPCRVHGTYYGNMCKNFHCHCRHDLPRGSEAAGCQSCYTSIYKCSRGPSRAHLTLEVPLNPCWKRDSQWLTSPAMDTLPVGAWRPWQAHLAGSSAEDNGPRVGTNLSTGIIKHSKSTSPHPTLRGFEHQSCWKHSCCHHGIHCEVLNTAVESPCLIHSWDALHSHHSLIGKWWEHSEHSTASRLWRTLTVHWGAHL